ncbi:MAG TPA: hypothetical protein VIG24_03950 [Acidimicrobiia bacterium]
MADGIEVGAAAPELELVGSDGSTRGLADSAQPVVLYMMRAYN